MSLLITITKAPDSVSLSESSKTFDMQGGTIGRGSENTWVLEDPERFLSTRHCQVSNENGQFYIADLSTNGTFFNGSSHPMGKGTQLPFNDGDTFSLGDYEFAVSFLSPLQQSDPLSNSSDPFGSSSMPSQNNDLFSAGDQGGDPFGQDNSFGSSPFSGGHVSNSDPLFSTTPEETDPLAALDKAQGGSLGYGTQGDSGLSHQNLFDSSPSADPFSGASHSDQADPMQQQVSWPNSVPDQSGSVIPDDWDDDLLSATTAADRAPQAPVAGKPSLPQPGKVDAMKPATSQPNAPSAGQDKQPNTDQFGAIETEMPPAQQQAAAKTNAKIQAELELLKKQVRSQQHAQGARAEITVDPSLVDALGFNGQYLADEQITQINAKAGEVMREMIKGLMQVLSSRSSIKNEFRMNVTTIQPIENNPIKFSANVDDALENMFIKQGNSYKKPVDAVRESFEGIAEHQIAIIAGIRAAFKSVIERFDPVILEARFAKQNKGGLIPGSQKAKNWGLYSDYYSELLGDIDNSFQFLFGDEFVQAYEEQLQKLAIAKKLKKNPDDE